MSNEVNQAYLRAYIKNRVASSREREASMPLPTRQVPTSQGGLENLYRRADAAREQIPAPKTTRNETVRNESTRNMPDAPSAVRPNSVFPAARPIPSVPANTPAPQRLDVHAATPVMVPNVTAPQATTTRVTGAPSTGNSSVKPVVVRNVLGTRATAAEPIAPATPSFATMPTVAARGATPTHGLPGTPKTVVRGGTDLSPTNTQAPSPQSSESAGVWSPLGAERGMKGAGVFRQQPAVVVNNAPHFGRSAEARAQEPVARQQDTAFESERFHTSKNIRIDKAHIPATNVAQEPLARTAEVAPIARSKSPEQFAREAARREIEEKLVREERKATAATSMAAFGQQIASSSETQDSDTAEFRPSWEVDRFFWPEVLYQLESSDKQAFENIGRHLISANQDGLRVMAVTSGERGVGRSTVAMHLARASAAAGLRVALLDADTSYPSLIDQLRLDMDHGWQDSLFENVPLEEVAVRSMEDNLTVFPLTSVIPPQQLHANLSRVAKFIKRIADAHDIVFLDSHRLNLEQRDLVGSSQENFIDAAVVVVDTELSIKEKVDTAISILQGMGVASIGLVENFHA